MNTRKPARATRWLLAAALTAWLTGCAITPQKVTVPVVPSLDLQRFMGAWYVIGVIP